MPEKQIQFSYRVHCEITPEEGGEPLKGQMTLSPDNLRAAGVEAIALRLEAQFAKVDGAFEQLNAAAALARLWTKHLNNDRRILNEAILTLELAEEAGELPEMLMSKGSALRPSLPFCPVIDQLKNVRRNLERHLEELRMGGADHAVKS